ncbi:MAG TPA: hypothetical protein VGM51_12830 [Armatimonadota bacterium]|jgi:hypothetical protein
MPFNVKKHLIRVQGGREYLPVAYRLVWFRDEHPDWGIDTHPVSVDVEKGIAVFQAAIHNSEGRLMSSGTKMETARNFGDFVEKAETGAIGRALGVLGYGTQFAPEFDERDRLVDTPVVRQESPAAGVESRPVPGPLPGGGAASTCGTCSRPLTKGQADFSAARYGRALCPAHQPRA